MNEHLDHAAVETTGHDPQASDPLAVTARRNFAAGSAERTMVLGSVVANSGPRTIDHSAASLHRQTPFARLIRCCWSPSEGIEASAHGLPEERLTLATATPGSRAGRDGNAPFLSANLGDPTALGVLEDRLSSIREAQLVLLDHVLEYLRDPRPLLRVMRRFLKRHRGNRLLIATPEREAFVGSSSLDPIRLWSTAELEFFLESSGFEVRQAECDRSDRLDPTGDTIIREVGCDPSGYERFLLSHGLPPPASRLVLLGPKDPDGSTKDVRLYLSHLERVSRSRPLVLTLGQERMESWLCASMWSGFEIDGENEAEAALAAVLHLVFLYDDIRLIECQDETGSFFRVAQARRAGLLPPQVGFMVVCHGSTFLREKTIGGFRPPEDNYRQVCEKITLELADTLLYPTRFIQSLYEQHLGLRPLGRRRVHRLPYCYAASRGESRDIAEIDTLLFLAGPRKSSVWDDFRAALASLLEVEPRRSLTANLCRVLLVGTQEGAIDLPDHVRLEVIADEGTGTLELLTQVASRSLAVLDGGVSSHPYHLLQAVDANCQFLMPRSEAAAEMIPEPFQSLVLCPGGARGLLEGLERCLGLSLADRSRLIRDLKTAMSSEQAQINPWFAHIPPELERPDLPAILSGESPVSVVVPVYNRPFDEIADLIQGLNAQILPPREVIFVDDGSTTDFATQHAGRIQSLLSVPARFIRHLENRGLAAARNTGIMAVEGQFAVVHDSDNIACNDFLYRGCLALATNPRIDVATFWLQTFEDGQDWTLNDESRQHYRPVSDGLVISLTANYLGDAMAVYRLSTLKRLGGWDESDRAMWEDWALYLKMLGAGSRLLNVPNVEAMYRVRPDSMLRTYPEYDARLRLARALTGLSMFEAVCLKRILVAPPKQIEVQPAYGWRVLMVMAAVEYLKDKPRLTRLARWLVRSIRWAKRPLTR